MNFTITQAVVIVSTIARRLVRSHLIAGVTAVTVAVAGGEISLKGAAVAVAVMALVSALQAFYFRRMAELASRP